MVSWFPLLRPFRRRWNRSSPLSRQSRTASSRSRERRQNPLFKSAVGFHRLVYLFFLTASASRDSLRLTFSNSEFRRSPWHSSSPYGCPFCSPRFLSLSPARSFTWFYLITRAAIANLPTKTKSEQRFALRTLPPACTTFHSAHKRI